MGLFNFDDFDIQVGENLLERFKMPDLPKFDGTSDLKTHLKTYLIVTPLTRLLYSRARSATFGAGTPYLVLSCPL